MIDAPITMKAHEVQTLLRQVRGESGGKTQTRHMPTKRWEKLWKVANFREIEEFPGYLAGRDGHIYREIGPDVRALKDDGS